VEKRIPKRKLYQPEEPERTVLVIVNSASHRITPNMFNCINVYPDDITHLKKGTISRPIHLTYDELELTEGVKEHFQRKTEEVNSIHYLGNFTHSYQYSERGLFKDDEIIDILHEMGIYSIGNNDEFMFVTSDHTVNKLSYVASLALGGKDGCLKLFKNSIDLFSARDLNETARLPILHPTCAENINYYSNLWRKHLAQYLPSEIAEQSLEFINDQNFTINEHNKYFDSAYGQIRAQTFTTLKGMSAIDWKKDHTCGPKRYLDNRIMSYVTTFCEVTIFEINLCYCPINDECNKYRGVIRTTMGLQSRYLWGKFMFVISTRDQANKMDKLKDYRVLVQQKPSEDMKWIFTEEECWDAPVGTLLWKLWTICYNKYLVDINNVFPNPILNTETSLISKGETIPEEDRHYMEDKNNFFKYNSGQYWIITTPNREVLERFGMTKPKRDQNKIGKDNENQSETSEKEQSDSESEKLEKRGRRK
jgi:hypothetical protein